MCVEVFFLILHIIITHLHINLDINGSRYEVVYNPSQKYSIVASPFCQMYK